MSYFKERDGSKVYVDGNESGLLPVEDKILVLPDKISEQVGMLYKPERAIAQEQMAQVKGLLVAVGGNCFEDWDDPIPQVGTRVMLCKYAGIMDIPGADHRRYQLCTDRDITAIIQNDAEEDLIIGERKQLSKAKSEV